jgi:myo-inositol-1(or 4)-monophosphatase
MSYELELEKAKEAAHAAAKIITKSYAALSPSDVAEKRLNDLVTVVDINSQNAIVTILRESFPGDYIVAEENLDESVNKGIDRETSRCWYIDPLDGTTNYIHAFPIFAVNIALEEPEGDKMVLGVTFDPMRGEMFHAVSGAGAYLNDKPIHVSGVSDKSKTLFVTGFPFRSMKYLDDYLKTFKFFFTNSRGIRRAGSAALDLAYVASGRAEAFWELTLSPWDMAAGVVLIEEAGGKVTDFFGENNALATGHIVASNGKFHEWMCEEIQKVFPKGKDYSVD